MYTHESNTTTEVISKLEARLFNISEPQRLLLLLMSYASFNNFSGADIVRDLVKNRDLWESCLMENHVPIPKNVQTVKEYNGYNGSFMRLRDLHPAVEQRLGYPIYNVNTLWILTSKPKALKNLSEAKEHWRWNNCITFSIKDSASLMGGMPERKQNLKIVRFWWD